MKRTIAAVLAALMTILCIGWGYSESDALNDGIEAEEIILDQLPEPEQESEEDMATGDKLVNLDDLKVAYDKQQEDTNSLKSAFDYFAENGIRKVTSWSHGTLNDANVFPLTYNTVNTRVHPTDFIFVNKGDRIKVKAGSVCKFDVIQYSGTPTSGTKVAQTGARTDDYESVVTSVDFFTVIYLDKNNTSNPIDLSTFDGSIEVIPKYMDKFGEAVGSGKDLDNVTEQGCYTLLFSNSYSHAPSGASGRGVMLCANDGNIIWQIILTNQGSKLFSRYKVGNGSWTSWVSEINPSDALRSVVLADGTDLNSLTNPGISVIMSNYTHAHSPEGLAGSTGILVQTVDGTGRKWQILLIVQNRKLYSRYSTSTGWLDWYGLLDNYVKPHEISILFVGNSLTQDGIAYLPYLLKNYYPEVAFKFYMWYNGGKTLAQQYVYFTNDTPCEIYSVAEGTPNWYNYNNSKKMSDILSDYTFDIVCMQDYFNFKDGYSSDSDLADWRNCQNYIANNYEGGNGLEFITLLHAPKRDKQDDPVGDIFARTKSSCGFTLLHTIAQDMIPNGIAVYRALSTDLDSLGDAGHLSPDGTHTQEGLPCLLQTYTTLCWLFDKLAINKSVYGLPFKMTTAIYNTINVPGPNLGTGVIEGTDAQNLLAQQVAIQAYKEGKQFVMNSIFSDE